MHTVAFGNGSVPALGLGTMRQKGEAGYRATLDALEIGYRHLDTAQKYENEEDVGRGIEASAVPREDIFLTTKVDIGNAAAPAVRGSTEESLKKLRTDYVDLLMYHWPSADVPVEETLEALAGLAEAGKARFIGVCNFPYGLLMRALDVAPIAAHQVEYHPFLGQQNLLEAARRHGHALVAYCPLARGRVPEDPVLREIGGAHGKTPAQVALRWLVQQPGVAAIPGSGNRERQAENFDVFDFELSPDEMGRVSALDRQERAVNPPFAPDWYA